MKCDKGAENGKPGSGCTKDCKTEVLCGNGVLDAGEECDLGPKNGAPNSGCDKNCKKCPIEPVCGNGIKEEGEEW
jgi:hypothetical protein